MPNRVKLSYDFPRFFEAIADSDLQPDVRVAFRNLVREIEKLQVEITRIHNLTAGDNAWTNVPSFDNSWADAGNSTPAYMKIDQDVVILKGVIDTGSVGSSAFTLPSGYRPSEDLRLVCISNGAIGRVNIITDGTVVPASPSNNAWVSLDGLSFRADT